MKLKSGSILTPIVIGGVIGIVSSALIHEWFDGVLKKGNPSEVKTVAAVAKYFPVALVATPFLPVYAAVAIIAINAPVAVKWVKGQFKKGKGAAGGEGRVGGGGGW